MKKLLFQGSLFLSVAALFFSLSSPESLAGHSIDTNKVSPQSGGRGQSVTVTIPGSGFVNNSDTRIDASSLGSATIQNIASDRITATLVISQSANLASHEISIYQGPNGGHRQVFNLTVNAAGSSTGGAGFQKETLPQGPQTQDALFKVITTVMNWVFTVFIIIATLFIILAGFQFVTGGKPEEARQKLMWAAVGIVVAVIAKGLPFVIKSALLPGAT